MNTSTQSAGEPSMLDPVYGYRDDLVGHFKPASAYERLLLGVAAQALKRFHDAQTLERRLFEKVDPLELLTNSPDTFKTITCHVADCERAWRKSLEEIRRAIRQREAGPTVRRSSQRPAAPPPQPAPPRTPTCRQCLPTCAASDSIVRDKTNPISIASGEYNCQVTVLDPESGKANFWQSPVLMIE